MITVTLSHSDKNGNQEATASGSSLEQACSKAYLALHPHADIYRCRVLASTSPTGRYAVRFALNRYSTLPGARRYQGLTHTAVWNAQVSE